MSYRLGHLGMRATILRSRVPIITIKQGTFFSAFADKLDFSSRRDKQGVLIMQEATIPLLSAWQNFYVIVGSASAALTGLMFVVITLIASRGRQRSGEAIGAFGTPTVVHLCSALLISALLSAPWPALWHADLLLGICGLAGVIYMIIIIRRARRQTDYQPVLEDWLWHTIFPFISYAALLGAALAMSSNTTLSLFVIGAATVLFLFIGIHNAWDTVTYMTFTGSQSEDESQQ